MKVYSYIIAHYFVFVNIINTTPCAVLAFRCISQCKIHLMRSESPAVQVQGWSQHCKVYYISMFRGIRRRIRCRVSALLGQSQPEFLSVP